MRDSVKISCARCRIYTDKKDIEITIAVVTTIDLLKNNKFLYPVINYLIQVVKQDVLKEDFLNS